MKQATPQYKTDFLQIAEAHPKNRGEHALTVPLSTGLGPVFFLEPPNWNFQILDGAKWF